MRTRAKYISLVGALVGRDGWRIASGSSRSFLTRMQNMELPASLQTEIAPLLIVRETLNEHIHQADEKLEQLVKQDAVVKRLASGAGRRASNSDRLRRNC